MINRLLSLSFIFFLVCFNSQGQRNDDIQTSTKSSGTSNTSVASTTLSKPITSLDGKHQISFFVGGGMSSLQYTPTVGVRKDGSGFTLGLDYSYYWHRKWGITSGFMFDRYASKLNLDGVEIRSLQSDGDIIDGTQSFVLISNFNGLIEEQNSYLLSVPILFRFRQPFSKSVGMMIGAGPKFSFDVSSKSFVSEGTYNTHGYYPQYSGADSLNFSTIQGFGTYAPRNSMNSTLGFGISVLSDLLLYYKFNSAYILYAGPYIEYQLNKTSSNPDQELVTYNSTNILEPYCEYHPAIKTNVVEGANRMAYGGKVGFIFDFGGYKMFKKEKADKEAKLRAEEAALLAAEANRIAELNRKARADSLANALRLEEIRNKAIADSIAYAQKMNEEARRRAELNRLAEEQRIRDSIANAKAHANDVAVIMDIRTKKLNKDELDILKLPIVFKLGSADITDQSKINAQRIGTMLSRHPDLAYQITGHTCDLGNDEANYKLGLRRAQTVYKEFERAGVMSEQILTFSKGETEPLVPNTCEENRQRNRRVVVVIEDDK